MKKLFLILKILDIARILGVPLGNCKIGRFADGEVSIQVKLLIN